MNKHIKLLFENINDELFNDDNNIFNNNDDYDIISKEILNYNIGDIYYKDSNPYAICCGDSEQFKDKHKRFCLLNYSHDNTYMWSYEYNFIYELGYKTIQNNFHIETINDIEHVDENGYNNIKIIKSFINRFPAFEYCFTFGEDVYLPAIDELQILYINLKKLNNVIEKLDFRFKIIKNIYWSSSQYDSSYSNCINFDGGYVFASGKQKRFNVLPFFNY